MNNTEAKPIPKLLIVPKIEFKKLGMKLKFTFDEILASFNIWAESILWLSRKTVI